MVLLVDYMKTTSKLSGKDEVSLSITDVIKQFDHIERNVEKAKENFYSNKLSDISVFLSNRLQKWYYGFNVPEKYPENLPENKLIQLQKNISIHNSLNLNEVFFKKPTS